MWTWKPLQESWWNKKATWWAAVQKLLLWKRVFTASLSTACFRKVAVSKLHLTALLSVFCAHWWWFLSDYVLPTLSSKVCSCCRCIHRPSAATGRCAALSDMLGRAHLWVLCEETLEDALLAETMHSQKMEWQWNTTWKEKSLAFQIPCLIWELAVSKSTH